MDGRSARTVVTVASPAFGLPSIYKIICFIYLFYYDRERERERERKRERDILHMHFVPCDLQWSHITPQQRSQVDGEEDIG